MMITSVGVIQTLMLTVVRVVEDLLVGKEVVREVEDREVVVAAPVATTAVEVVIANTPLTTTSMTNLPTPVGKDLLLTNRGIEDLDPPIQTAAPKVCIRLPALAATRANHPTSKSANTTNATTT